MVTLLYFAMVLAVLAILSLVFVQIEKDVGFGFSLKPLKIKVYAKTAGARNNAAAGSGATAPAVGTGTPAASADTGQPAQTLTTVTKQSFTEQTVQLDGRLFEDCTFANCTLVYSGHTPASFAQCRFTATKWQVNAAAENVMQFLGTLYREGGESGRQWVEGVVGEITKS